MNRHLEIIGTAMILLALAHVFFPKHFGWKKELAGLNLLARQMMYVHTAFIALAVLLMGVLCLTAPADLVETPLGRTLALGLAIFWGCRLLVQFFGYSAKLWRGKRFETSMHILFTLLWIYFTAVFAIIATGKGG